MVGGGERRRRSVVCPAKGILATNYNSFSTTGDKGDQVPTRTGPKSEKNVKVKRIIINEVKVKKVWLNISEKVKVFPMKPFLSSKRNPSF